MTPWRHLCHLEGNRILSVDKISHMTNKVKKYLLPILTIARSVSEESTRSSSTIACLKVRLESAYRPPDMRKVKVRVRNNQPLNNMKVKRER